MHRVVGLAREYVAADHAVIATDAHGNVVFWDAGAEQLYGWSGDEVIGRSILEITPAELSRAQADEIMARLAAGRSWSGEFTVRARDGRRFEASVVDIPVRSDDGAVLGIVGISRRVVRVSTDRPVPMPIG